jgi:hypothetical protein
MICSICPRSRIEIGLVSRSSRPKKYSVLGNRLLEIRICGAFGSEPRVEAHLVDECSQGHTHEIGTPATVQKTAVAVVTANR